MIVLHALPSILAETITQPFYVCGEAHLAYAQFLPACSLLAYLLLVFAPLRSSGAPELFVAHRFSQQPQNVKFLRHFYCNLCTLAGGKGWKMGGKTEENESEIPVLPGTALFGHCLLTHPMGVINVCGALFTAARTPAVFSLPNESIFYGRPRIRRIR